MDIDITFEEASYIKDTYIQNYQLRELTLVAEKKLYDVEEEINLDHFETIDQIVEAQLIGIESESYDTSVLLSIYHQL